MPRLSSLGIFIAQTNLTLTNKIMRIIYFFSLLTTILLSSSYQVFSQNKSADPKLATQNLDTTTSSNQINNQDQSNSGKLSTNDQSPVKLDTENLNIEKSVNLDKKTTSANLAISKDSIAKNLENILNKVPLKSLMFDQAQYDNIEKAIEAMKNNEPLVIDGISSDELNGKNPKKDKNEDELEDNAKSYLYLSSIIFLSDKNWSLWINNKRYNFQNNLPSKELYFKEVSTDYAKIIWSLSISKWKILSGKNSESLAPKINDKNQVEVEFTLKPNQTYILTQNKVVNGRVIINKSNY